MLVRQSGRHVTSQAGSGRVPAFHADDQLWPSPFSSSPPGRTPSGAARRRRFASARSQLNARGVTVTVASPYPLGEDAAGIQYLPLGAGRRSPKERSAAFIREAEALIAFYRKTHIVHTMVPARGAHIYTPRSGVFAFLYRRTAQSYETPWERALHRFALRLDRRGAA